MSRIGVVGPVFPDSFADNVVHSLAEMGHTVRSLGSCSRQFSTRYVGQVVQVAARAWASLDRALQRAIIDRAKEFQPELVISVESEMDPSTVRSIQSGGARVALWFPDALSNLGRQFMFLARYDLLCFKDPVLVERCESLLGLPVLYLPEACNPAWHRPPAIAWEPVIVAVGNLYPARFRLLERLAATGLPLRLYGPPPARWLNGGTLSGYHTGQYVAREEKAAVFRSAAAVLNNLHPAEMASMNCRLFEAAGSGAAVLTEHRSALDTFFDIGSEVAAFETFDELVDQARVLLRGPDHSRSMGDRATVRAHRDHTYHHRLTELIGRCMSGEVDAG